jgi:hypothetical protein
MTRSELKGLSWAAGNGRWMAVGESRELPHRPKWILADSGQDGLIGVVDMHSIVGIGDFLSRKGNFSSQRQQVTVL